MKTALLCLIAFTQLGAALSLEFWVTSGLDTKTDNIQASCTVGAGHHDCGSEYNDVIAALDKARRCPTLSVFVSCAKSECSNSKTFQSTYNDIDSYCNGMTRITVSAILVTMATFLAFLRYV